jgi:Ca-activated chloride channel family protein
VPTWIPRLDLATTRFGDAAYLWLLVVPAALVLLWGWRVWRRRRDVAHFRLGRVVPVRERFSLLGDLGFWFFALLAASLLILALARPQAVVSAVRQGSVDLVVLQDASASMYVIDVPPDRWRRSIRFVRMLAESLRWQGDRVALALFAQLAAPQVRLTKDPNSLFFFVDHLGEKSPFPLENAPTWDTNIEEGIRWGLRLIEKDEDLFGKSGNPKAFVVISDGQSWSGKVAEALTAARQRNIPVHVVGIGTTVGGMIPEPMGADGVRPPPVVRSSLDRSSLVQLAQAGGGEYFEIGAEPDRLVAFRIIDRLRRQNNNSAPVETLEELYPRFLMAAAVVLGLGLLCVRKPTELLWHGLGVGVAGGVLLSLLS